MSSAFGAKKQLEEANETIAITPITNAVTIKFFSPVSVQPEL